MVHFVGQIKKEDNNVGACHYILVIKMYLLRRFSKNIEDDHHAEKESIRSELDFCYAYQEYFQGEKKDAAHYFIVILNEDVFYHAILYPIVFFKNI